MNEDWVREAIASQEEHIKRSRSCRERIGEMHRYRTFGDMATGETYQACVVCGVPENAREGAFDRAQAREH